MKNSVLLLSMFFAVMACQTPSKQLQSNMSDTDVITKQEALDLLHKWTDAYLTGNPAPLNEVLDETWKYSGSGDGKTSDKVSTIEEFTNADYSFGEIVYEGVEVELYGDVAVVRGAERMAIVGSSGKDTTELRLRFTDVYQKKNGLVKAIATHSSPINN